ncbi:MAG TPA: hypothetical protein VFW50_37595, partial [Streptosporangiaceae bacterium]|nr:hypothetical protein [Streptosporangiaceae bacterium]
MNAIIAMMTEDAWLTMPPMPLEYQGRQLAAGFLTATAFRARLIPARANGQPAFGSYVRDPDTGRYHTVGLMVLTLSGPQISAMTRFDPAVLPRFGLPSSFRSSPAQGNRPSSSCTCSWAESAMAVMNRVMACSSSLVKPSRMAWARSPSEPKKAWPVAR